MSMGRSKSFWRESQIQMKSFFLREKSFLFSSLCFSKKIFQEGLPAGKHGTKLMKK
jgi:hypothetical protein